MAVKTDTNQSLRKSKVVEYFVRSQISSGKWPAGYRLPSENEISEQTGAGHVTIKNVVSRLAEEGLFERKQRLGTFVAENKKCASIAILLSSQLLTSTASRYEAFMLQGLVRCVENAGFKPMLKVGYGYTAKEFLKSTQIIESAASKEIVGVLSLLEFGNELENELIRLNIPCVSIVSAVPVDTYTVVFDFEKMLKMGTDMLTAKGYKNFVIMYSEPPEAQRNKMLYQKLSAMRLETVGGDRNRLLHCFYDDSYIHAYKAFKSYWEFGNRPDAIFFFEDAVFDIASRAILELGIKVPGELPLITSGNHGNKYCFPVPVTAIEFDLMKAIELAWNMLKKRIFNEEIDEPVKYVAPDIKPGLTL